MARATESPKSATGGGDGLRRYEPPAVFTRPCPLCASSIELVDEPGPQEATCGSCGLHCTMEVPVRPAPPPAAQTAPKPLDEDSAALIQWLEREPRPLRPSDEPAPEVLLARKRVRRISFASVIGIFAAVAVSMQLADLRASKQIAHQRNIASAQAHEKEELLLSEQARLQQQSQAEQSGRLSAERQARLMNAKYMAHRAVTAAKTNPWRGVALATQAINATLETDHYVAPEAHQSLRDALFACSGSHAIDGIVLEGHSGPVSVLATSANGRWLASGSHDSLRLWDLCASEPQKSSKLLIKQEARVSNILFTADSARLITGSADSSTRIWEMATIADDAAPIVLPGRQASIQSMAVSPNGRWLATTFESYGDDLGAARLWDLADGPRAATSLELSGQGGRIQSVAISPDSRWLALGVGETVRLWDLNSRVPAIASLARQCQHGNVTRTMFTADQQWLLTSGGSASQRGVAAQMWSLTAEDPSTSIALKGHERAIKCIATSPDSRWLVTVDSDGFVTAWDLQGPNPGSAAATVTVGKRMSTAAAISSDGHWLAVSTEAGKVHLWNLAEQGPASPAIILHGGGDKLLSLAFSADTRWLAAGGTDRKIRLWNLDLRELLAQASAEAHAKAQAITKRFIWFAQPDATVERLLLFAKRLASCVRRELPQAMVVLRSKSLAFTAETQQRVLRWQSQPGVTGLQAGLIRKKQPAAGSELPAHGAAKADSTAASVQPTIPTSSSPDVAAAEPRVATNSKAPAAASGARRHSPYERLPQSAEKSSTASATSSTLRINPR